MSVGRLGLVQAGQPAKQCPTLAEMTDDATATAAQIAEGATAYVKGQKITGTYEPEPCPTLAELTADATATAADIVDGKTAYVQGEKLTGTLVPVTKIDVAAEGIKLAYSTFEEVPEVFDFSNVTDISNMFKSCNMYNIPPIIWSNITSLSEAFQSCKNISNPISIKLTTYNRSEYGMFDGCTSLTQISQFTAPLLMGCRRFFKNTGLQSIGLIDIPICKDLSLSFSGCNFLNFPKINAPQVENCQSTFENCTSMQFLEYWDFSNVTTATDMFKGCSALTTIKDIIFLHCDLSLADSPNLDQDTLLRFGDISNAAGSPGVAALKTLGLPAATLTFNTSAQAFLESEGIIAKLTDENWTVNFADSM